jgi:zinc protease
MGFERDIKDMPNAYDYSKSFFNRYYRPENCVLLLAGDFDKTDTKALIEKLYGGWKPGYVEPRIESEPEQSGERSVDVAYEGRTLPIVWIGYKGDAFDPVRKSCVAAYLLADLAYGENSEVYKKLVIREQKVQWVAGDFAFNRDPKLYDVYTRVKEEEDIPYVIEELDRTAETFKTELVSAEDLENIKQRSRYSYLMRLDTPGNTASRLARTIALTGGIDAVNELYATMKSLTPEDIRAAAQKYLQKDRRTVLVLKGEKS